MSNNNQFMQRNSESKKQNENFDNISQKSNLNKNEKMINDSSNEFSIFHINNAFEKNKPFKKKNKLKKCNIYPFFGCLYEKPIEENTPNIKDNINIFQGGQVDNEYQIYENITKGRNIDNNFEKDIGFNGDLDNKDINISHSKKDNNNIDNNEINNNNIYNINEGESKKEKKICTNDKEDEKIYTKDKDEDRKLYHNNRNYQQDLTGGNSGFSNYFKYIKNYCDDCQRFPFFLKMDKNEPEFILANKNMTLREVLIRRNIDVENIDLYCKDYQKKVFLDETIESQNIRPYSYIQNIAN